MKKSPHFNTVVFVCAIAAPSLFAQEISIGEAIDAEQWVWTVETVRTDSLEPIVLDPENVWHPVTDISSDGIDSLKIEAPSSQPVYAIISTTIQGPFRLSFKSRTAFANNFSQLQFQLSKAGYSAYGYLDIGLNHEWEKTTRLIREVGEFELSWRAHFFGDQNAEAWLDEVQITKEFPPTLQSNFVTTFGIPLGKTAKLGSDHFSAVGFGELRGQWYKDDNPINGATGPSLSFPAANAPTGVSQYRLEISDDLGTVTKGPVEVFYFDLNAALDNHDLEFTIPTSFSQDYSSLFISGDDAPDGEDALIIQRSDYGPEGLKAPTEVTTQLKGPVIMSYVGEVEVQLNGISPDMISHIREDGSKITYFPIIHASNNVVRWVSPANHSAYTGSGILDQVQLSEVPIIISSPQDKNTVEGVERSLTLETISLGIHTYQLVKDEIAILESNNPTFSLKHLSHANSGMYYVRIISDDLPAVTSDPFEITVYETIGDAVEQPNLEWTYQGEKIWIPQIFNTYDGDDAAALLDDDAGTGTVSTEISGPSLVSFWQKGSYGFEINGEAVELDTLESEWRKAEIVLTSGENTLSWSNGFFDRLQIEQVELIGNAIEQPDLEWTYEGNRIWIPQTKESYDGEDAAALLDGNTGLGSVSTTIPGPALVSFWWKDGSRFYSNESYLEYEGEDWQQVQTVVWDTENTLTWHSGFFDQLQIEDLNTNPFKLWAFSNFSTNEVINNLEAVQLGDRDHDTLANLIEWALNKNVDFSNLPLAYKILEEGGEQFLGLTFSRPADLGQYFVYLEASNDLESWEKIESIISETYHESNDTYTVTIRDTKPFGEGRRFIRLRVSDKP